MPCLRESIRQVDPSLQELVETVENASSLALMILAAWRLARVLAVKVVEEVLAERAACPTEWSDCPQCGTRLHSKGFRRRQIISLIGVIRWTRRVARCPKRCKIGQIAPLDQELGLAPHQRTSFELKRVGCLLAIFVPFETAATLLSELLPTSISPGAVWHWVREAGQRAMARLNCELEALAEGQLLEVEALDEATAELPLLIGADAVKVPFRPEKGTPRGRTVWREVKVAILARLGRRPRRDNAGDQDQAEPQLEHRRLVAVLGSMDALRPRLWLEAVRQGVLSAKQVVWLSDGGPGFWTLYATDFATEIIDAIGILDFYHAAQNLWKGAKAWLDGRTKPARAWFTSARHRLRHGEADAVLADIAAALELDGLPDSARNTLKNLYDYLDTHLGHIQYERFKALGLPIGSGMVESACKWLIQQRFKGVGMRWSQEGFNHLLHLRLAWVNDRFDELFALEPSPN